MSLNGLHFCMENSSPSERQLQHKKSRWGIDPSESVGPVLSTVGSFLFPFFKLPFLWQHDRFNCTKELGLQMHFWQYILLSGPHGTKSWGTGGRGRRASWAEPPGQDTAQATSRRAHGASLLAYVFSALLREPRSAGQKDTQTGQWDSKEHQPRDPKPCFSLAPLGQWSLWFQN